MDFDFEFGQNEDALKILVVEDYAPDQVLLKNRLKRIWPNCTVFFANSVQKAYVALKSQKMDMIVLDLNLPDGYGPNTVKDMRKVDRTIPIIVTTSMLSDITVHESMRCGANNIILKNRVMTDEFSQILEESLYGMA